MLVLIYLAAIVAANLSLVWFVPVYGPLRVTLFNAAAFIALDLVVRDRLHARWHHHQLRRKMGMLITTGAALSFVLALIFPGPGMWYDWLRVACASALAFWLSSAADAWRFEQLRHRPWLVRSNHSNIVGAAVDSLIFVPLAFLQFQPITMFGQFAAKSIGGFIWSVALQRKEQQA